MANAKKCDRCGKYYTEVEADVFDQIAKNFSNLFKTERTERTETIAELMDFCPSCSKSFKKWMVGKEVQNDGK